MRAQKSGSGVSMKKDFLKLVVAGVVSGVITYFVVQQLSTATPAASSGTQV